MQMVSSQGLPSPSLNPVTGTYFMSQTVEDGGWLHPLGRALGGNTC